jgi:hypothetical protein
VATIHQLTRSEGLRLDLNTALLLRRAVGPARFHQIAANALRQINRRLAEADSPDVLRDARRLAELSQAIGQAAGPLGLLQLVRVAADLNECAERGDAAAMAAVLARMRRLARRATQVMGRFDAQRR